MEKSMKGLVCALGVLSLATVQAKTIALWPIQNSPLTREQNLRSAVNHRDPLTAGDDTAFVEAGLGWTLPPNPDPTAKLLFEPTGGCCLRAGVNTEKGPVLKCTDFSDELLQTLYPTHDHTVEGWVRFDSLPSGWCCVWYPLDGSSAPGGLNFTLRTDKEKPRWVLYVARAAGNAAVNDVQFGGLVEPTDLTNRWMHIALTFKYNDPACDGLSAWRFYMDGVQHGDAITHAPLGAVASSQLKKLINIGGRTNPGSNRRAVNTSFAYWRVSDECLAPEDFLNADGGGAAPPAPPHPTIAYWKLDKDRFGGVSGAPSVGSVPLNGALFDAPGDNAVSSINCSSDSAFENAPPNAGLTFPDGNFGSAYSDRASSYLVAPGLGRQLTVTNSFTVEGWFKPCRDSNVTNPGGYIFSTRDKDQGWAFQLYERNTSASPSRYYLEVFAQDSSGATLANNAVLSGDLTYWNDWKHVALVYDAVAEEGRGVWTCYLDGVKSGSVPNANVPTGDAKSIDFHIGGRKEQPNSFFGSIDCVRVTRGVLSPNQFLNATTDAQPAPLSDVLALYPLNARSGLYLDGSDLMGGSALTGARSETHTVVASDASPVITNPDSNPAFRGDPIALHGSAGFRTVGGNNAYLATARSEVRDALTQTAWTLEGYFKRAQAMTGDWEFLFAAVTGIAMNGTGIKMSLTYRERTGNYPNGGFILYAQDISGHNDVLFPGTDNTTMKVGEWQHVALSYEVVANVAHWKLYLDGDLVSQLEGNYLSFSKPAGFIVGGRPNSSNTFKGCISSVRLSRGALAPEQLLCAVGTSTEPERETLAYWPLESNGSTYDVDDRVQPLFTLTDIKSIDAQEERARIRPQKPDASPDFVGDPRVNNGSVRFTSTTSHASARNLGLKLDVNAPFTVEGWLKWENAVAAGIEYLAGTFRTGQAAGWFLGIDHRGDTPKFRLFAKGTLTSLVVDKCFDFDILPLQNVWTHIALTYRPRVGNGTWTLFVDGREAGSLENDWAPGDNVFATHIFKFGTYNDERHAAFVGSLDMWRVSRGALEPDQFLFAQLPGTFMIVC